MHCKTLYMTYDDEVAFEAHLIRTFPDIWFFHRRSGYSSDIVYPRDIMSSNAYNLFAVAGSREWKPVFEETPMWGLMDYRIVNYPERIFQLHRLPPTSAKGNQRTTVRLTIGWPPPDVLTPAQQQLADRLTAMLRKIGTFRLALLAFDCSWVEVRDEDVFAGTHAVRWALENEERRLGQFYRPVVGKRRRLPSRRRAGRLGNR